MNSDPLDKVNDYIKLVWKVFGYFVGPSVPPVLGSWLDILPTDPPWSGIIISGVAGIVTLASYEKLYIPRKSESSLKKWLWWSLTVALLLCVSYKVLDSVFVIRLPPDNHRVTRGFVYTNQARRYKALRNEHGEDVSDITYLGRNNNELDALYAHGSVVAMQIVLLLLAASGASALVLFANAFAILQLKRYERKKSTAHDPAVEPTSGKEETQDRQSG